MNDAEIKFGADTADVITGGKQVEGAVRHVGDTVAETNRRMGASASSAKTANNAFAGLSRTFGLTANEARNLSFQINDIVGGLFMGQRPLAILMQQGPQVAQIFGEKPGGIGGAFKNLIGLLTPARLLFVGVAGAVGVMAMAFVGAYKSEQAVIQGLAGAGRQADLTKGQFNALAMSSAETGKISISAARGMGIAFAQTGKIQGDVIARLIAVQRDFAYVMGVKSKEATKLLAESFADPARGAAMLNEKLGFLDRTTFNHIRTLVEQNRLSDAQRIMSDELTKSIAGQADKAGVLARAWNSVANAAKNAWDWLGRLGAKPDDSSQRQIFQQQIDNANRAKAEFERRKQHPDAPGRGIDDVATLNERIARANAQIAAAQKGLAELDAHQNNILGATAGAAIDALAPKLSQIRELNNQIAVVQNAMKAGAISAAEGLPAIAEARRRIAELQKPPTNSQAPDRLQVWDDQLRAQLESEKNFFGESTAAELAFWQGKVALTTAGTKDRIAVEHRIYDAEKKIAIDGLQTQLETIDARKAAAVDNYQETMRLENEKLDLLKRNYGEDSREYQRELENKTNMERTHTQEVLQMNLNALQTRAQINEITANMEDAKRKAAFDMQRADIAAAEQMHRITSVQAIQMKAAVDAAERAQDLASAQVVFDIQRKALQDEAALNVARVADHAATLGKIEVLEAQHRAVEAAAATAAAAADAAERRAIEAANYNKVSPWANQITSMVANWATGIQSMQQMWAGFGQFLLQRIVQWASDILANWIMMQLGMTTATAAGETVRTGIEATGAAMSIGISAKAAIAKIAHNAAVAAAGAYAALASIPYVGPFIAPAAAALALAAVLALGSKVFSAKDGFDKVPHDGAMTALHKDEMVLSARYAVPLRSLLGRMGAGNTGRSAAAAGSQAGGADLARGEGREMMKAVLGALEGRTGDVNNFSIAALDAKSFDGYLRKNVDTLIGVLVEARRNGAAVGAGS